jgi:hypothetical protein
MILHADPSVDIEELPRMNEAEVNTRIEALREIGDAPCYLWRLPAKNLVMLAQTREPHIDELNGKASFSIYLLEAELRARSGVKRLKTAVQLYSV